METIDAFLARTGWTTRADVSWSEHEPDETAATCPHCSAALGAPCVTSAGAPYLSRGGKPKAHARRGSKVMSAILERLA